MTSPLLRSDFDDGLVRRAKALSTTAPLHDLDARKGQKGWTQYQMSEVALRAIDLITVSMDFDTGTTPDDVVGRLIPHLATQAPEAKPTEHRKVAEWVLDNLINVGSPDRGFTVTYGAYDDNGSYTRMTWPFKLIEERRDGSGEIFLRASAQAINVLVGALDTDVESAQIAAEVQLQNLIDRGRLTDARSIAEQALYRTVQYIEQLRAQLEATKRDVRNVDWLKTVPELIFSALGHIAGRMASEAAICETLAALRDDSDKPIHRIQAAVLLTIVEDCQQRHAMLQERLSRARQTFREEQDRQQFSGRRAGTYVDLHAQLLQPLLRTPVAEAEGPLATFLESSLVTVPRLIRLVDLVEGLFTPTEHREALGEEIEEPELVGAELPSIFSDDERILADELFDLDRAAPIRLSGLLRQAREAGGENLAHLVALRTLHAYHFDPTRARTLGDVTMLMAVDDGTELKDDVFEGADLIVGQAVVHQSLPSSAADEATGGEPPRTEVAPAGERKIHPGASQSGSGSVASPPSFKTATRRQA